MLLYIAKLLYYYIIIFQHDLGVWHRDLKNENILLASDNTVRVADFGISSSDSGLLSEFCGTPTCCPPQTFKCIPYKGALMDVWTLGKKLRMVQYLMSSLFYSMVSALYLHFRRENVSAFFQS